LSKYVRNVFRRANHQPDFNPCWPSMWVYQAWQLLPDPGCSGKVTTPNQVLTLPHPKPHQVRLIKQPASRCFWKSICTLDYQGYLPRAFLIRQAIVGAHGLHLPLWAAIVIVSLETLAPSANLRTFLPFLLHLLIWHWTIMWKFVNAENLNQCNLPRYSWLRSWRDMREGRLFHSISRAPNI